MPSPVPSPPANTSIPAGATVAGKILATAIAAPITPAAGIGAIYVDSTSKNLAVKNDAGAVSHGVRTKASVVTQFLTAIADDGTVAAAQPAFSDISGSVPSGTAAAGSLLFTSIAAPGTPAAGKVIAWADSTTPNWMVKDSSGNVLVSVAPGTAPASRWFSGVALNGSFTATQPAFTDISGTLATAQIAASAITYAKIQNVSATARLLGRKTAGAGVVEELSASDAGALGVGCAILDTQNLTAQGTLTTASWTANAWSRIEIELFGISNAGSPANSDIRWRANADSSAKYGSSVQSWTSSPVVSQDLVGTATSVQVASLNTTHTQFICGLIRIFPKTVSSRLRSGSSEFTTIPNSATNSEYYVTRGGFIWADSATDMTFATILFGSSATFTGTMIVRGYL